MVNSCRECENCKAGMENYCLKGNTQTYTSLDRDGTITQGGYSTHVVVDEDFVLKVPEAIPYEAAAPLLCAGITTYSPLAHWNAGPGKKVAVVGMGGLGHLAVKIAVAKGAEVTVLSRGLSKKEDGLRHGAKDYRSTSEEATFTDLANTFDLIINTVSAPVDLNAYLRLLRLDGTLVSVGAPPEPLPVGVFTLFGNRRSFAGSSIGSIAETQEMLDFCAANGIAPEIEVVDASQVNDATSASFPRTCATGSSSTSTPCADPAPTGLDDFLDVLHRPLGKGLERTPAGLAERRQLVLHPDRGLRVHRAHQQPVALEGAQRLGGHLLADPLELLPQLPTSSTRTPATCGA